MSVTLPTKLSGSYKDQDSGLEGVLPIGKTTIWPQWFYFQLAFQSLS